MSKNAHLDNCNTTEKAFLEILVVQRIVERARIVGVQRI